jgi:FdhD protein
MNDEVMEIECIRVDGDERETRPETIAVESRMNLIVNEEEINDFLYSSGLDEELVVGFMLSSGLVNNKDEIDKIEIAAEVAKVWTSIGEKSDKTIKDAGITISHRKLLDIRRHLIENQKKHRATRGFHGAIIWELTTNRRFACEDIGRHNAVDKVIGYGIKKNWNLTQSMVLLSGRLVSNIASKCKNSGIPLIASMTVATDGGIKIATDSNMTMIGSLSDDGFWLYNEGVVRVT